MFIKLQKQISGIWED